ISRIPTYVGKHLVREQVTWQAAMPSLGFLRGEKDQHVGTGEHRTRRHDEDGVAQARRTFGAGDADALVALATEELGALAGRFAQPGEDRAGRGEQPVLTGGRRQLGQPWAEDESSVQVAGDQSVMLQSDGETVGCGPSQSG